MARRAFLGSPCRRVDFYMVIFYDGYMKNIILTITILLMVSPLLPKEQKENEKKSSGFQYEQSLKVLNGKYQHFLNMIAYIAEKDEIRVFKKLPTIRDREIYINFFWKQRDPTPETEENEYKIEIEKRFTYVNKYFSRGTPLPGWKTDRGKVYMILGEPNSIETFDNVQGLFPARVWYYYGDETLGLPTYFNVAFFKRGGTGDWVIYDPVADGPASLLVGINLNNPQDYRTIYNQIRKLSPTLAGPSVSMIPGQMPHNFKPSPMNSLLMAKIYKSPTKKINVSYATDFMNYKGYVTVESSVSFIENTNLVCNVKDERFDCSFIFFSIKPKKISVNYFPDKNKYYFNFLMVVSVMQKERVIYEHSRNFDSYIGENNLDILKSSGIVIHDYFPVVPGKYKLRVFLQNKVGKEFCYFDKELNIPSQTAVTYLAPPIPFYKKEYQDNNFFCAYTFNNQKLSVDTDKSFALNRVPFFLMGIYNLDRQTWEKGRVEWDLIGLNERNNFKEKGIIALKNHSFKRNMNFIFQVPLTNLKPDFYEFSMRLLNHAGIIIDTKNSQFMISPFKDISRPTEIYNQVSLADAFYFDYILGLQFHNIGERQKAVSYLEKSILANPNFNEGRIALLKTELELKNFSRVLEDVDKLKNDERFAFGYHQIKGEALFGLKKYKEALMEFLEANKINNSDVTLINMMGETFLKLEDFKQALKAFEASLQLNDKQPEVIQTIKKLKKDISKNK